MAAVASVDPPSATITSRTRPDIAAGTRLKKQRGSSAWAFKVGMTALIMSQS
jgi:hypothetical protein